MVEHPHYGSKWGHKKIFSFWHLSPLLLLLEILNVLGGNRRPYTGSLDSQSNLPLAPPHGLNLGHIISAFFFFLPTALQGLKKPYIFFIIEPRVWHSQNYLWYVTSHFQNGC